MHPLQQKLYELIQMKGLRKFDSFRHLGDAIGEEHPQKIKHHLQQLEKLDLIKVDWKNYEIEPKAGKGKLTTAEAIPIPILGAANCGMATLIAEERPEGVLLVSKKMIKVPGDNLFALRAVGNSMNNAEVNGNENIEDGDFVIIDSESRQPSNGDYVLSVINGSANVKRFYDDKGNGRVILRSESSENYPPIFIHVDDNPDFFINGKVISVIKVPKKFD